MLPNTKGMFLFSCLSSIIAVIYKNGVTINFKNVMRKITFILAGIFLSSTFAFAQQSTISTAPESRWVADSKDALKSKIQPRQNSTEAVIWQEDFANGIPSSWVNIGYDGFGNVQTNCLWEYRGTNTTPDTGLASRGAYWGGGTIGSPTYGNGFVVFDSDYLDNGGVAGNFGNGSAAGPNFGTLTTGLIDLSSNPNIELSFHSLARTLGGNDTFRKFLVLFSSDGGMTYPDTVLVDGTLASNTVSDRNIKLNISNIVGGEDSVRIQFAFNALEPIALTGGLTAYGYYFWAIDDIVIQDLPPFELQFVDFNDAPAIDMIFGPATGSTNAGVMALSSAPGNPTDQTRDITFDCNVLNYGFKDVNDVQLKVDIFSAGALVSSRTSGLVSITSGAVATWDSLNTYNNAWNPTAVGDYDVVYSALSDSAATIYSDTVRVTVDPTELGLDFSVFDSDFGTENGDPDGQIYSSDIDLVQPGIATSLWIDFRNADTYVGAQIEVAIYDTGAFDGTTFLPSGLFGTSTAAFGSTISDAYTLTVDDSIAGVVEIPLTDGTNEFINLPAQGVSVNLTLFSNGGANHIQILNDRSFSTAGRRLMYVPSDATWYSGYTSNIFNAPLMHIVFADNIGVEEKLLQTVVTVGPNPATDYVDVRFRDVEGNFELTMMNIAGQVVSKQNVEVFGATTQTVDVSSLPAGVYMLNINNGKASVTHKISVQ